MARPLPIVLVWTVLGAIGGIALARSATPVNALTALLILGAAWGALVFFGVRGAAVLQRAVAQPAPRPKTSPPHRMARLLPVALSAGAVAGLAFGGALFLSMQWVSTPIALAVFSPLLTAALALFAVVAFKKDTSTSVSTRSTTLARWVLLDTALPAALVCAPVSAGFAWLRLRGAADVEAVAFARHFALTFVLWGGAVGTAAFLKTRRERVGKLVDAPLATATVPSPGAFAGILAILVLVVGPRVLPPLPIETVVALKAVLGFVVGGAFSALGALRGARDPNERERPPR